jgi:hypothetical protein
MCQNCQPWSKPRTKSGLKDEFGITSLSWETCCAALDTSTPNGISAANLWSQPWAESGWQYCLWPGMKSMASATFQEELILRSLACCCAGRIKAKQRRPSTEAIPPNPGVS